MYNIKNKKFLFFIFTFVIIICVFIYKYIGIDLLQYKILNKTIMTNSEQFKDKNNSILFLGDSIVYGCNWEALFARNDIVNKGVSGNNTTDILNRIDEIVDLKPKTIFLSFGVNDLRQVNGQYDNIDVDKSIKNYSLIINNIKTNLPNSNIYIESVLSVNNDILKEKSKINNIYNFYIDNYYISVFNTKLKQLAIDNNITYIDNNNFIPSNETTIDGLHPNLKGYIILKKNLNKYINV